MRLRDKVAIVTGSTSGIGEAAAERFAAEGGKVTTFGRNAEHGQVLERELRGKAAGQGAGDSLFVPADVSRPDDIRKVVDATLGHWGQADILVNNAAIMALTRIADLEEADWDKVLGVNLKAAFLFAKHCLVGAGGAIVNVSSVHAQSTSPTVVPDAASKGGTEAFTRGLAVECGKQKIRVNALRPGAVNTPMLWGNQTDLVGQPKSEVGCRDDQPVRCRQARGDRRGHSVLGERRSVIRHRGRPQCGWRPAGSAVGRTRRRSQHRKERTCQKMSRRRLRWVRNGR